MTDTETAPTSPTGPAEMPPDVEQFLGELMGVFRGSMLCYMIDLGRRTALFPSLASGPATSEQLAARAGLHERYVREWLGAMVTGGIVDHEPAEGMFSLPPAHAALLTEGPMDMTPYAAMTTHLGKHLHKVATAFRDGGGVPYAEYRPEFTDVMDGISRVLFDGMLLDVYLPMVPGLGERLEAGAHVADVACGTGHALVLLAQRFPASTFVGIDMDDGAIARARAEAAGAKLTNLRFEVGDAAQLEVDEPLDVVFVFDAIHDQVSPDTVLARIHDALADDGLLFMKEPHGADTIEGNRENPMAPILYSVSTLHCMTVSLAHDGAGIGTMFGEGLARQLLADAGFTSVDLLPAPGDPGDAIYVCRP
jgi:SAM-dependent methyltransferase